LLRARPAIGDPPLDSVYEIIAYSAERLELLRVALRGTLGVVATRRS
jgi:hypothetical protein